MAYTAIESMRKTNEQRFGRDLGPMQPPLYGNPKQPNDLKSSALRFLHERCEGLLFDPAVEAEEKRTGIYQGKSISAHMGNSRRNLSRNSGRSSAGRTAMDAGTAEAGGSIW